MRVAFGPVASAFGSWEWIGADLCHVLQSISCETNTFCENVPACDIAVFVKFKPSAEVLASLRTRCRLVYCPVDIYDSAATIDADANSLQNFDLIIVHCHRLKKYLTAYAPVDYLDHHLKFVTPPPAIRRDEGPLLWIGNRSNLPPVTEWVNNQNLPGELWVLTDFPEGIGSMTSAELGFSSRNHVRAGRWTKERHLEWTSMARAAFDVKGSDFRSRHKPPAKALDFLVSGVPLAMNAETSIGQDCRRGDGLWQTGYCQQTGRIAVGRGTRTNRHLGCRR